MAHGTVSFQTDNIHCDATKLKLNNQLTIEGAAITVNNNVNFKQDVYFKTPDGWQSKPKLKTQYNVPVGHEVWITFSFSEQYDTFYFCENPLLTLGITYIGGNHIVQFKVMTQEDLDMNPGDGFDFALNFYYETIDVNINKPFNFEPGKQYMIIFQQTEEYGPINIFWTELTDYAN